MLKPDEIKEYFLLVNSHAKKELGQNFLINEEVCNNIVSALNIQENDKILEIGPGLGSLTSKILTFSYDKYVVVEYDKKFVDFLNNAYGDKKIEIVNNNILKYKNDSFNKIIGNLPYYISTEIILEIIEDFTNFEEGVFMVQKEFYERIITKDKREKTAINFFIDYAFKIEKLFVVKNVDFFPQPKVDSVVFKMSKTKKITDFEKLLFKIIKISLLNRRKTLNNNLKSLIPDENLRNDVLKKANLKENVRAEDLTIDDFTNLVKEMLNVKNINL